MAIKTIQNKKSIVAWVIVIVMSLATLFVSGIFVRPVNALSQDVMMTEEQPETVAFASGSPEQLSSNTNLNAGIMTTSSEDEGVSVASADGSISVVGANDSYTFYGKDFSSNVLDAVNSYTFSISDDGSYPHIVAEKLSWGQVSLWSSLQYSTSAGFRLMYYDIYADDILIYQSVRCEAGKNKGLTCEEAGGANVYISLDELLSKGLVGGHEYNLTAKFQVFFYSSYSGGAIVSDVASVDAGAVTLNVATSLPDAPTKTGYTFSGWYTDEACTQPYEYDYVTGDVTLYAGFTANTYTVTFNANGGTGSMSAQTMTYDTASNLTANAFSRDGYTFAGWAISASGSVVYTNSQSVQNLASEQGANINLYAVWASNEYTISFDANGGTGEMTSLVVSYDQTINLTANAFTNDRHRFLGWSTSAGGNVVYEDQASVKNLVTDANGTITLYAQWELITYTVSYVVDGSAIGEDTVVIGDISPLSVSVPAKEGYTFTGWALSDGTLYTNQTITSDIVLTATYNINVYTVTFIVDGSVHHVMAVEHGTNLKALLAEKYPSLLYDTQEEVDPNF